MSDRLNVWARIYAELLPQFVTGFAGQPKDPYRTAALRADDAMKEYDERAELENARKALNNSQIAELKIDVFDAMQCLDLWNVPNYGRVLILAKCHQYARIDGRLIDETVSLNKCSFHKEALVGATKLDHWG